MKIQFTKRRLKFYLISGIVWLVFGTTGIICDSNRIFNYGFLILGIISLGTYLFEIKKQYLTIENGIISKNYLIPKKINLNEIKQIKKIAGAYVLKTDSTELRINTVIIEENSLAELKTLFDSLNLEIK